MSRPLPKSNFSQAQIPEHGFLLRRGQSAHHSRSGADRKNAARRARRLYWWG